MMQYVITCWKSSRIISWIDTIETLPSKKQSKNVNKLNNIFHPINKGNDDKSHEKVSFWVNT